MPIKNSILVVEGAHDAAFFSILLKRRGFVEIEYLNKIPEFWKALIPEKYPISKDGRLDRVVRFPVVLIDKVGNAISIVLAGGYNNLCEALRNPLELKGANLFHSVGLVADADWEGSATDRFSSCLMDLSTLNTEDTKDQVPGFPLTLPVTPGVFSKGSPKLGIHVLPNNDDQGALENILIECAELSYPSISKLTSNYIENVLGIVPKECPQASKIQTKSGFYKAHTGMIANVFQPGSSLAVTLLKNHWFTEEAFLEPSVVLADKFLDDLLS